MKVIFLESGQYSVGNNKILEVTKQAVENALEYDIKDADYIEGYVNSGKALLPCMLGIMGNEKVIISSKPIKNKPGRKPKARV